MAVLAVFSSTYVTISPIMAGAEQEGHGQKDKYQLARDAKGKLIDKANRITEEEIQKHTSLSFEARYDPEERFRIRELARQNQVQLESTVNEIPELKSYLERSGQVTVTREYWPRLFRPRARISLSSEGVVYGQVGKHADVFPLTNASLIALTVEGDGALHTLAGLSPKKLLERVAHRIDPDTTRNKLGRYLSRISTQK